MRNLERILVIRLGALGDLILCFQAFQDIRLAHPGAKITLLTTAPFKRFAETMPWFDDVIVDGRDPITRPLNWWRLIKNIRALNPDRVYDLQGKFRQTILYTMLGGPRGPEWSGATRGCSHPRLWPPSPGMHFTDFISAQLRQAHVPSSGPLDLRWFQAPLPSLPLAQKYAVLIPGCAKGREYKRWPLERFVDLAALLAKQGILSLAVGTKVDADVIQRILALSPHVTDLAGRTDLLQLATLAREAVAVVGNDTGPTHLAAAVGAPTLALISGQVNPAWSAPRGPRAAWRQSDPLEKMTAEEVLLALTPLLDKTPLSFAS